MKSHRIKECSKCSHKYLICHLFSKRQRRRSEECPKCQSKRKMKCGVCFRRGTDVVQRYQLDSPARGRVRLCRDCSINLTTRCPTCLRTIILTDVYPRPRNIEQFLKLEAPYEIIDGIAICKRDLCRRARGQGNLIQACAATLAKNPPPELNEYIPSELFREVSRYMR